MTSKCFAVMVLTAGFGVGAVSGAVMGPAMSQIEPYHFSVGGQLYMQETDVEASGNDLLPLGDDSVTVRGAAFGWVRGSEVPRWMNQKTRLNHKLDARRSSPHTGSRNPVDYAHTRHPQSGHQFAAGTMVTNRRTRPRHSRRKLIQLRWRCPSVARVCTDCG